MNNSSGTDLGDWLIGSARRHPEGLLSLLAAGQAKLMMRSGRGVRRQQLPQQLQQLPQRLRQFVGPRARLL